MKCEKSVSWVLKFCKKFLGLKDAFRVSFWCVFVQIIVKSLCVLVMEEPGGLFFIRNLGRISSLYI